MTLKEKRPFQTMIQVSNDLLVQKPFFFKFILNYAKMISVSRQTIYLSFS